MGQRETGTGQAWPWIRLRKQKCIYIAGISRAAQQCCPGFHDGNKVLGGAMRCYRYRILLIAVAGILSAAVPAKSGSLTVVHRGDHLRVSAPQMHFLEGKPLEALHNGSTVTYILSLTVVAEQAAEPTFLLQERFLFSFDLWEEKYSVVQAGPGGRSASRLTAPMAEAWCLESMPIPLRAVPERQSFMVRLECHIEENEKESGGEGDSRLTLAALIDIFSRKREAEPLKWEESSGSLRLEDLRPINQTQ